MPLVKHAKVDVVDGDDYFGAGRVRIRFHHELKVLSATFASGVGFGAGDDERLVVLQGLGEKQSGEQVRARDELDLLLPAAIAQNTSANVPIKVDAKK